MKVRIVEEVALDAPDFVVHLLPFGARINPHFHGVQLQFPFAGLGGLSSGCDEPLFVPAGREISRR